MRLIKIIQDPIRREYDPHHRECRAICSGYSFHPESLMFNHRAVSAFRLGTKLKIKA